MGLRGWGPRAGARAILLWAACTILPATVRAADSAVAVIAAREQRPAVDIARSVQRILDERGAAALSDATVLSRIETRIRPAPPATPETASLLAHDRDDVLEAVAFGRDRDVIARGTAVFERVERSLASTLADGPSARHFGDICLFLVRAELHRGDAAAAHARARECLRLVPDLAPSEDLHPPDVRAVLDDVRRGPHGKLRVEPVPPQGAPCRVRLQGRLALSLPGEVTLQPGRYVVRIECRPSEWQHEVEVRSGETTRLSLAPDLEAGLHARPLLTLAKVQPADLAALFEWLLIEDLWAVEEAERFVVLTRYSGRGGRVETRGSRTLAREPASDFFSRLERAVAELSCAGAPCGKVSARSESTKGFGYAGAVAGGLAMGVSWFSYARYQAYDEEYATQTTRGPDFQDALDARKTWRTTSLATSIAGSVLFSAAAPFWLPERKQTPWWAWTAGAVGVAAIGTGAVLLATDDGGESLACPPDYAACERPRWSVPLPPLLMSQGVALLSLPATYMLRRLLRSDAGALEVGGSAGAMHVTWTHRLDL